jgi:ACR3 family arsenite efflux pump ArsB
MSKLSKFQPAFIILSAFIGIALGRFVPVLEHNAGKFIEIFLMIMLFVLFLNIDIREISKSFSDLRFSLAIATITFPLQPVISLVLVMGPLIELPILAVNLFILKKIRRGQHGRG